MKPSCFRYQSVASYLPLSPRSVDHLVVGGGIAGLSVAAALTRSWPRRKTLLVNDGTQLGSRPMAGLVSSGVFNPPGGFASRLNIRGRELLYPYLSAHGIAHRKTEKLVIATSNDQVPYLDWLQSLSAHPSLVDPSKSPSSYESNSLVPAYFLSPTEVAQMEPSLGETVGAVFLPEAGVCDALALQRSLTEEIRERGGSVVIDSAAVEVRRDREGEEWVVNVVERNAGEGDSAEIRARVVVFADGANQQSMLEDIIPQREAVSLSPYQASLFSAGTNESTAEGLSRIIYPAFTEDATHLGARLIIDPDGRVWFGPDLVPFNAIASPNPSTERIKLIAELIHSYFPSFDPEQLVCHSSYVQHRLAPPSNLSEVVVRHELEGRRGLIEMYGFDEDVAGAFAVGEHVAELVRQEVYGG